jgi:hypothetical protein
MALSWQIRFHDHALCGNAEQVMARAYQPMLLRIIVKFVLDGYKLPAASESFPER